MPRSFPFGVLLAVKPYSAGVCVLVGIRRFSLSIVVGIYEVTI